MVRTFTWQDKVEIHLSDDGTSITMVKPRKTTTAILIRGEPEEFAQKFFVSLSKAKDKYGVPVFAVSEDELNDCIKQFADFLRGKEEISLEFAEEEEKPKEEVKEVAEITVPLTKFAEAKVEEKPKEEKKKEQIPTVDMSQVVVRFQELMRQGIPVQKAYEMLEKEFNVPKDVLICVLPIPKETVPLEKMMKEVKPAVPEQPQPTTAPSVPVTEAIEEIEGYEYITSKHLEWLEALAHKVYNIDKDTLFLRYKKEAEQLKQKIHAKTGALIAHILFNEASKHNIIQFIRRRVYHLIFLYRENEDLKYKEVLADKSIEGLKINRCYRIPELKLEGRLIAMTFPPFLRDVSTYSSDMPLISKIEPIADLPAIPIAGTHKVFEPITIREAIDKAKESPTKEITDAIYVTIKQINEWGQGTGAFLAVHDGSDPNIPVYAVKIKLPYENPFGLDEGIISNSVDKTILCFGIMTYNEPRGRISEGLTITPMFISLVE